MSNIVSYTNNIYFTHPIPFFNYIKNLILSKETPFNIIQKIQTIMNNIDNGVNGFKTSTTMAFNSLYEYNELKKIIKSNQNDADKIICLNLFLQNDSIGV